MVQPAIRTRVVVAGAAVTLVAVAVVAYILFADRGLKPGPLRPPETVNSFGIFTDPGTTVSLVIQLRGEEPVTVMFDGLELANPGPGLELVDSGILLDGFPGKYASGTQFPMGRLGPIAGTTWTAVPGDQDADVFLNLGIRADIESRQSVYGVWLDYHVGSTPYRVLLPWLLSVCPLPWPAANCGALGPDDFSPPPR